MVKKNVKRKSKNTHDENGRRMPFQNDTTIIPIIEDVVNTFVGLGKIEAKQIIMALAYQTQKVTRDYVAKYFGHPFGSATDLSVKTFNNRYDSEKAFKNKVDQIKTVIEYRIASKDMLTRNLEVYQELKNQL